VPVDVAQARDLGDGRVRRGVTDVADAAQQAGEVAAVGGDGVIAEAESGQYGRL
jgi:hypothetical protein